MEIDPQDSWVGMMEDVQALAQDTAAPGLSLMCARGHPIDTWPAQPPRRNVTLCTKVTVVSCCAHASLFARMRACRLRFQGVDGPVLENHFRKLVLRETRLARSVTVAMSCVGYATALALWPGGRCGCICR